MFRARFATVRPLLALLLPLVILLALGSTTPAVAAPAPPTVAAGTSHSCARLSGGGLKCWGDNGFGQLGDGTTVQHLTPVSVSGLSSGVAGVVAGDAHTCALTSAGGAKCWGDNSFGQLGNGTTTQLTTPGNVSGLASGVANIAAGADHSCAITTAGAVRCWGYNGDGELGNGTTTDNPTPGTVSGLTSGVAAVAAGAYHTCAATTAGAAKCWGYNAYGELGNGTTTASLTPASVSGLSSGVAALAAGSYHTCALTAGAVKCWGFNGYGELGDGTTTDRLSPVAVSGLTSGVAAISAGALYTCALTTSGAVKCWGYNNYGQLGDGSTSSRSTPTPVVGLSGGVVALAAGYDHTCALTSAGGAKCWGYNSDGELGNGTTAHSSIPVDVTGTSPQTDTDGDGVPDVSDLCPGTLPGAQVDAHGCARAQVDADADGVCNPGAPSGGPAPACTGSDNCPNWPNPTQALPPWPIPSNDPDCDGFTTAIESFVGTNPILHCGTDAWPPDINNDGKVSLSDVLKYAPVFNSLAPGPPYNVRYDLNADNKINLSDVLKFAPFFNQSCAS